MSKLTDFFVDYLKKGKKKAAFYATVIEQVKYHYIILYFRVNTFVEERKRLFVAPFPTCYWYILL